MFYHHVNLLTQFKMAFVSIIVPVYNSENFLDECIQSVLVQSFKDWELLLINDGSTDKSPFICDKYASLDSRIQVIHKINTGVSDSRNIALDKSKGKYVIFLDSDDYWYDNTSLKQLVDIAEKYDLDILQGEYKVVDEMGHELYERPLSKRKRYLKNKLLDSGTFYIDIMSGENFLWLSLIRKNVIGNLHFNIDRSFLEDMEFYAYLFLRPCQCMYTPLRFYAYRKNENSVSSVPKIKNLVDSFTMSEVFNKCTQEANNEILKKVYRYNSVMMYNWTLETISHDYYYKERFGLIDELSLKNLNRRVRGWAKSSKRLYPFPIYLSPLLGIYYFRAKHWIVFLLRRIKSNFILCQKFLS